jgi:hypothetical protein
VIIDHHLTRLLADEYAADLRRAGAAAPRRSRVRSARIRWEAPAGKRRLRLATAGSEDR